MVLSHFSASREDCEEAASFLTIACSEAHDVFNSFN